MPPHNQSLSPSSTFYFRIASDNHNHNHNLSHSVSHVAGAGGQPLEMAGALPPMMAGDKDFSWMYPHLKQMMREHRTFDPTTEALLILAFSVFILFGCLGNGLVCYVVARNKHMRTPRNIFIINLAVSDLTLCVLTQPLNLYLLVTTEWDLGSVLCKFVTMCQGTNLFVSTISITAIALDRFQVIVYPTKESMKQVGAAIGLLSVWLISFLMASPALLFQVLHVSQPLSTEFPDFFIYNCIEDEDMHVEKRAYTVAQMVVQYILPFIILTVAHLRICNKLRYRMVSSSQQQQTQQAAAGRRSPRPPPSPSAQPRNSQPRSSAQDRRSRRKRKTNLLLATIALVFALSWLPLNIFNLLSEFNRELFYSEHNKTGGGLDGSPTGADDSSSSSVDIDLAYAICHMLVLCSACVNPMVYGWFNDNFRTEFLKILLNCCPCCKRLRHAARPTLLCCGGPRGGGGDKPQVPAITLTLTTTAASAAATANGGGHGGGRGGDGDGGGVDSEKLSMYNKVDDDDVSATVNYDMTVVTRVT